MTRRNHAHRPLPERLSLRDLVGALFGVLWAVAMVVGLFLGGVT